MAGRPSLAAVDLIRGWYDYDEVVRTCGMGRREEEREGSGGGGVEECQNVQARLISLWLFGSVAKGNGRTRIRGRKGGRNKGSRERQVCNRRYHLSAAARAPGCMSLFTSSRTVQPLGGEGRAVQLPSDASLFDSTI